VRGMEFCKRLVEIYDFHIFDNITKNSNKKIDPTQKTAKNKLENVQNLLWAASQGDLAELEALYSAGVNMNDADYDYRAPLHLAASENNFEVVKFLVERCKCNMNPIDRWNNTPLDDAVRENHEEIENYLISKGAKKGFEVAEVDDGSRE